MVYCGLFPSDAAEFEDLREALGRLQLNDAALQFEPEVGPWPRLRSHGGALPVVPAVLQCSLVYPAVLDAAWLCQHQAMASDYLTYAPHLLCAAPAWMHSLKAGFNRLQRPQAAAQAAATSWRILRQPCLHAVQAVLRPCLQTRTHAGIGTEGKPAAAWHCRCPAPWALASAAASWACCTWRLSRSAWSGSMTSTSSSQPPLWSTGEPPLWSTSEPAVVFR